MSSDPQEDVVALHPKQPPEPTTYPTYPTYTTDYQLAGGLAAPTVSSVSNTEGKKEEEKAEEEYEPGSIPVEHLNVRSIQLWAGHTVILEVCTTVEESLSE